MSRSRAPAHPMQIGSVAVEFALILPIMLMLMFAMLQFGRIFWQYNVVQKATTDAARFLAAMPAIDMQNSGTAHNARAMAQQMVADAAEAASIRPRVDPQNVLVEFWCADNTINTCSYSNSPSAQVTRVKVSYDMGLTNDGYYEFGLTWAGVGSIILHTESKMPVTN
jgi:Flp pilus assembly protein TadG